MVAGLWMALSVFWQYLTSQHCLCYWIRLKHDQWCFDKRMIKIKIIFILSSSIVLFLFIVEGWVFFRLIYIGRLGKLHVSMKWFNKQQLKEWFSESDLLNECPGTLSKSITDGDPAELFKRLWHKEVYININFSFMVDVGAALKLLLRNMGLSHMVVSDREYSLFLSSRHLGWVDIRTCHFWDFLFVLCLISDRH